MGKTWEKQQRKERTQKDEQTEWEKKARNKENHKTICIK